MEIQGEWLREPLVWNALSIGAGMIIALFGWEIFRLVRMAAGVAVGAFAGWSLYSLVGVPGPLADIPVKPVSWLLVAMILCALGGFFLLRAIRTLGSFLLGTVLGFLSGKGVMTLFQDPEKTGTWWAFAPVESLLGAVIGGVVILVHEPTAGILMTSVIGSIIAGSALPWKYAPVFLFGISAPLQWWIYAGRPFPRRQKPPEEDEPF